MNKMAHPHIPEFRRRDSARLRVLDALRRHGPQSRAAFGRITGLSPASITALIATLIGEGLLIESGTETSDPQAGPGRPATLVSFNPAVGLVIGLWVGFDRLVLHLADYSGRTIAASEETIAISNLSTAALVETLARRIAAFRVHSCPSQEILALGVAFQGFVDRQVGTVIWSPVTRNTDMPLASALTAATGLPVELDNDASAMAYAITCGNRDLQRGVTACVMLGDGVGVGVFIEGQPLRGSHGGGIEFGHVPLAPDGPQCRCGARGCVESYLADYALYRDALAFSSDTPPMAGRQPSEAEMLSIIARADGGERAFIAMLENAGRMLAQGITTLVHLFRPSAIVFCGPGMRAWPYLERGLEDGLRRYAIPNLARDIAITAQPFETTFLTQGVILGALGQVDRKLGEMMNT
jgi:predicted NBD/HSP70 family sugar kinase